MGAPTTTTATSCLMLEQCVLGKSRNARGSAVVNGILLPVLPRSGEALDSATAKVIR